MAYIPALPRNRPPVPGFDYFSHNQRKDGRIDVAKSLQTRRFVRSYQQARATRLLKHLPGLHNQKSHGNQFAKTPWLFDAIVPNMGPAFPDPHKWTAHVTSYARDPKYRNDFNAWYEAKAGKPYVPWSPLDESLPPPIPGKKPKGSTAPDAPDPVPVAPEVKPDLLDAADFKAALAQGPVFGSVQMWSDTGHHALTGTFTYDFENNRVEVDGAVLTAAGAGPDPSVSSATLTFDAKGRPALLQTFSEDAFAGAKNFTKPTLTEWTEDPSWEQTLPGKPEATTTTTGPEGVPDVAGLEPVTVAGYNDTAAALLQANAKTAAESDLWVSVQFKGMLGPPVTARVVAAGDGKTWFAVEAPGGDVAADIYLTHNSEIEEITLGGKDPVPGLVLFQDWTDATKHSKFISTTDKMTWPDNGTFAVNPAFKPAPTQAPTGGDAAILHEAINGQKPNGLSISANGGDTFTFNTATATFSEPEGHGVYKIQGAQYMTPSGQMQDGTLTILANLDDGGWQNAKWQSTANPDEKMLFGNGSATLQWIDPPTDGPLQPPEPALVGLVVDGKNVFAGQQVAVTLKGGITPIKGKVTGFGKDYNTPYFWLEWDTPDGVTTSGKVHPEDVQSLQLVNDEPEAPAGNLTNPIKTDMPEVWTYDNVDPAIQATLASAAGDNNWVVLTTNDPDNSTEVKSQAKVESVSAMEVTVEGDNGIYYEIPLTQIAFVAEITGGTALQGHNIPTFPATTTPDEPDAPGGRPTYVDHDTGEPFYIEAGFESLMHLVPGEEYDVEDHNGGTFTARYMGPIPAYNGAKPQHVWNVLDPGSKYGNSEMPFGVRYGQPPNADHPWKATRRATPSKVKLTPSKHSFMHTGWKVGEKRNVISAYANREVTLQTTEGPVTGYLQATFGKSPMMVRVYPKTGMSQMVHVKNVQSIEVLNDDFYQSNVMYQEGKPTNPNFIGWSGTAASGLEATPDAWKQYFKSVDEIVVGSTDTTPAPSAPAQAVYVDHVAGDPFTAPAGWESVKHFKPGHLYHVSGMDAVYTGPLGAGGSPVLTFKAPPGGPALPNGTHLISVASTEVYAVDKTGLPVENFDQPPKALKLYKYHQNLPEKIALLTPYVGYKVDVVQWDGSGAGGYVNAIHEGTPVTVEFVDDDGVKTKVKIKDIKTIDPTGPEYYQTAGLMMDGQPSKPSQVVQVNGYDMVPEDYKPYVAEPANAEPAGPKSDIIGAAKNQAKVTITSKPPQPSKATGHVVSYGTDGFQFHGDHMADPNASIFVSYDVLDVVEEHEAGSAPAPGFEHLQPGPIPAAPASPKPAQKPSQPPQVAMPEGLVGTAPIAAVSSATSSEPITAPPGFGSDSMLAPNPKPTKTFDVDEPAPQPDPELDDDHPQSVWTEQDWAEYLGDMATEGTVQTITYHDPDDNLQTVTGTVFGIEGGEDVAIETSTGMETIPLMAIVSTSDEYGTTDTSTPPAGKPSPTQTPSTAPAAPTTPTDHDPYVDPAVPIVLPSGAVDVWDTSWSAQPYKAKQSGSNPGGFYTDEAGRKWYIKVGMVKESYGGQEPYKYDDRSKNEAIAARVYAAAGVPVPNVELIDVRKRKSELGSGGAASPAHLGVKSEIVGQDGQKVKSLGDAMNDPGFKTKLYRGFAIDAWIANWDVAGTGWDNILSVDGEPLRVDVGGSMLYRAQGGLKGEDFTFDVKEIDTMRGKGGVSSDTTKLFSDMTDEQVRESFADTVAKITDADIDAIVDSFALSDVQAPTVKEKLKKRRFDMAEKLGVNLPDHPEMNFKFAYENKKIAHLGFQSHDDYQDAVSWFGSSGAVETANTGQSADATGFANIAGALAFAQRTDIHDPDEFNRVARAAHSVRAANGYDSSDMQTLNAARGWDWSKFADVVEELKGGPYSEKWKPVDWVAPDKWEGPWAEQPPQSYDPWTYSDWRTVYDSSPDFAAKWDQWMQNATESHKAGITGQVSGLLDPASFDPSPSNPKHPSRDDVERNNFFKAHLARTKTGFFADVPHTTAGDMAKAASAAWGHTFDASTLKQWASSWGGAVTQSDVLGLQWAALERYGFDLESVEKQPNPPGTAGQYFKIYNPHTGQWITLQFSNGQYSYLADYKSNQTLRNKYLAALAGWNYGAQKQWAKAGVESVAVLRGTRLSKAWCQQNGVPVYSGSDTQGLTDVKWAKVTDTVSQRGVASFTVHPSMAAKGGVTGGGDIVVVWRGVFDRDGVLGAHGSAYPSMGEGGGEGEIMMPAGLGYEVVAFDPSVPQSQIKEYLGEGVTWNG
ncbi:MAG: hypothetical protein MUF33_00420 [Candidatus Nanopelagicales bacterium]|jgi:hypothetical protein|nr:hypothetical protein [Candidatus Nanopelagicales bacterium]